MTCVAIPMLLDHVCVMNFGGIVLWERTVKPLQQDAVNSLIQNVLLEDRHSETEHLCGNYKVRWSQSNQKKFVVVAVFQRFLQLLCIDHLLNQIREYFETSCTEAAILGGDDVPFDARFDAVFTAFLTLEKEKNAGAVLSPVSRQTEDGAASKPSAPTRAATKKGVTGSAKGVSGKPSKPGKAPRSWDNASSQETGVEPHYSAPAASDEDVNKMVENFKTRFISRDAAGKVMAVRESDWSHQGAPKRGQLASWLRSFVGVGRELDAEDFKVILPKLKEKLIAKNVAVEVAETVCASVAASLKGTRLSHFESIHKTVENAMIEALRRILRPKVDLDILRDAKAAKEKRRPYSIVFCGVNGVGKSTSLSKVAFWLQQHDLTVLLAAGDTFRSGAVEQLAVHARCLGTELFQLGYNTDPTDVAAQSILYASKKGFDVVLIDTAGRMEDHESRMRALAKTIHENKPDAVLFVGEALVGNTGVHQLRKFNQCLFDLTPVGQTPRGIDGIVLTKFDTIDDKVGAALSMVYELGQPIVFVGVGQKYQDLKKIDPNVVVDALMQ